MCEAAVINRSSCFSTKQIFAITKESTSIPIDCPLSVMETARGCQPNVKTLFDLICAKCNVVERKHDLGIECGFQIVPRERTQSCVPKRPYLGIVVNWDQPFINSQERAKLNVVELSGRLYLPGQFPGERIFSLMNLTERPINQFSRTRLRSDGSRHGKTIRESPFISNEEFAEGWVSQLVNMIRKGNR